MTELGSTVVFCGLWTPRGSENWKHFVSGSGCLSSICVQLNPGQLAIPIVMPASKPSTAAGRNWMWLESKAKGR